MSMPEKPKDSIFNPEADVVEDEAPVEEAPVEDAPVEEAPVEDAPEAPTVKVQLADDYDGPTPVYVSTGQADDGGIDRVEVPGEIPATQVDNVTAIPYVEVAE